MAVTLPLEIYETFEEKFGKDDARKLVKSFEYMISDMTEYKWAVTREELFSRLASKEEISELDLNTKEQIAKLDSNTKELIAKLEKNTKEWINQQDKNTKELIARLEKNTKEWIKASEIVLEEKMSKLATKEEISKLATREELDKFATKEDLKNLRTELIGKLEAFALKLDRKFTIMFIILFFTVIFTNQNSLTFILKLLGLLK